MSTVCVRSDKTRAIAECKRLRARGGCMRECDCWHPGWREKFPPFCGAAMSAERKRRYR